MSKFLHTLALILVIIGGLNWLLVGVFSWDLIAAIFGSMTVIARVVYILVGLAALYLLFSFNCPCCKTKKLQEPPKMV